MAWGKTDKAPSARDTAKLETILGKIEALEQTTENAGLRERLGEAKSALLSALH